MIGIDVHKIVYSCAKRVKGEYYGYNLDMEDLISEGNLIVAEVMPQYDEKQGSVGTYLYGQILLRLRNYVSRDIIKHDTNRVPMDYVDNELESSIDERAVDLKLIYDKMEERDASIFIGIKEGLSYREIGDRLGYSKSTVERAVRSWATKYGDSC